jgi:hypothetical protein
VFLRRQARLARNNPCFFLPTSVGEEAGEYAPIEQYSIFAKKRRSVPALAAGREDRK